MSLNNKFLITLLTKRFWERIVITLRTKRFWERVVVLCARLKIIPIKTAASLKLRRNNFLWGFCTTTQQN